MATKAIVLLSCSLFLCSCTKPAQVAKTAEPSGTIPTADQSFRPPSAAEAFELQSKCQRLGDIILQDDIIGSALTHEQTSRYNPHDNRCYVRLSVSTADLTTPREKYEQDEFLYDGQTKEMLASVIHNGDSRWAQVLDSSIGDAIKGFPPKPDDVSALIEKYVSPSRHP
jgi:hypothetical protein